MNNNNENIIASIYKKYYADLRQYLLSYTHDVMPAEDMLQDLFLKLMTLDVITEDTARNLVFVMARRMIIDDARHKAFVRRRYEQMSHDINLYDNHSVIRKIEVDEILSLENSRLSVMASKRAAVYRMFRHEEYSAREIAGKLNISQRTVETHIYLASKEIKQYLKKII